MARITVSIRLRRVGPVVLIPLLNRWAVKEAAFKAMPNHLLKLSWHDAFLTKVHGRPMLCHTPEIEEAWKEAGIKEAFPTFHVSITHDGGFLTAFVVAETAG